MRLLILGGTTEANALVRRIAERRDLDPLLSLAGRTRHPVASPIPLRIGGFGGVSGLQAHLAEQKTDAVIDATHPFAAQMSRNAVVACRALRLPIAVLTRPAWCRQPGDRWTEVANMAGAVRALGPAHRRVFLTVGGLQLAAFASAPQHRYIVRTIDQPETIHLLPLHRLILARGPFSVADEIGLMRDERVEALVTKNSGGAAIEAKIEAARMLGVEVIIVDRPPPEDVPTFGTVDDILSWIETHRPASEGCPGL